MNKLTTILLGVILLLVSYVSTDIYFNTTTTEMRCDKLVKYEDGSAICTQNGDDNEN